MHRVSLIAGFLFASVCAMHAQWQIEDSHTTADLRGIDNVGGGAAWASGTNGTVLRTEDGGYLWQSCSTPPGAEHLDFRGIQAFDANTAIVMSSGKGDLSRLYKTTDGCHSWKLVFTNPDKDGFWDAIKIDKENRGLLLGDPVGGEFALWRTSNGGESWTKPGSPLAVLIHARKALQDEGIFAASNSSLLIDGPRLTAFVTGGPSGARLFIAEEQLNKSGANGSIRVDAHGGWSVHQLPLKSGSQSTGAFSVGYDNETSRFVVVGGDYKTPDDSTGTAASDGNPAETSPHGYRSAVAYDSATKTWITVGPNGTDISTDDGKNWRALKPDPARHEAADADRNWNALSLPFVVGPKGRIGKLNAAALTK
jgi:photosystem II stability/assembly factor-like uncharacterized protein